MSSVKIFTILAFINVPALKNQTWHFFWWGGLQGSLLERPRFSVAGLELYYLSWAPHLSHRVAFVVCVKCKVFVVSYWECETELNKCSSKQNFILNKAFICTYTCNDIDHSSIEKFPTPCVLMVIKDPVLFNWKVNNNDQPNTSLGLWATLAEAGFLTGSLKYLLSFYPASSRGTKRLS